MTEPAVAVVVACYELGRTLPEAVESALVQTRAPAEIVVVDDGSRDPLTRQVLARLEASEGWPRPPTVERYLGALEVDGRGS